ncbi:hypothetical protein [Mucilaginibacter psychrotolerans]|uniref:Uncharacterized protein n=1 Tax=Mucilaginibacter psychrotolerans TaxID=1524096 RepID=A0A4Y8SCK6_9SPHI|nr:hypothetical protein [Mucilaginibacter psychrotolerans]TFF36652.1 hypothetical protein E2R66_14455 [Mucilaginibacter psychrotolerans]
MLLSKEIVDNVLHLHINEKLIYKRWLDNSEEKVIDFIAYNKYKNASYQDLEYKNLRDLLCVRAMLKLKSTEEGGRKTGFSSGYRPNHVFEYLNGRLLQTYIGEIVFEGYNLFMPADEKEVIVRFILNQRFDHYINVGRKWWIHEAGLQIGEAEILEILPST